MKNQLAVSLNCPSCGGDIFSSESGVIVNCRYCGSTLCIENDGGFNTAAFKNKLDKDSALEIVQNWWKKGLKARDLKSVATITESYPIHLPFWHIETRTAGWICGYEEFQATDSEGNNHIEKIYREEMIFDGTHFSEMACDPSDLGIQSLQNFNGELYFEDIGQIPSLDLIVDEYEAIEHAKTDAISRSRASTNISKITFEKLHSLIHKKSMIYYPIWIVRYTYQNYAYFVTIDGITGQVLSGRAPRDPLYQSLAVTLGTSAGGLTSAGGIISSISYQSEVGIAGVILGLIILGITYLFFQHRSEVIKGDFKERLSLSVSEIDPDDASEEVIV
ncbi:MAG: hypothetical protein GX369_04130 [Euryarchaeota archaeon]|mgnify:CR=1 FL=1|nr:hypothetical protein [Euryarchaeota archaeon]